jgi:hypothetical protein
MLRPTLMATAMWTFRICCRSSPHGESAPDRREREFQQDGLTMLSPGPHFDLRLQCAGFGGLKMLERIHTQAIGLMVGLCAMNVAIQADSIVLEPIKDNSLIEDPAGALSNALSDGVFSGRTRAFFDNRVLRALVAFDV